MKEVVKEVVKEVIKEVHPSGAAAQPLAGTDAGLLALLHALREHSSEIAHDMKNPLNGVLALSQNVIQVCSRAAPDVCRPQDCTPAVLATYASPPAPGGPLTQARVPLAPPPRLSLRARLLGVHPAHVRLSPPAPLQGTFGELPKAASDQLGVVRSCAYHLLNMINQLRDCLRLLGGGDPEFNCGRVQLSTSIDEVRAPLH